MRHLKSFFSLLITFFLISDQAFALKVPSGLTWNIMPEVTFDFPLKKTGTKYQRELAQTIWSKNILVSSKADAASFVLIATAETKENDYYFTMFLSLKSDCLAAPNGDGQAHETDLFMTCPMRVIQKNKITKAVKNQYIQDYCYLNLDDEPGDLQKNHTEFAFDKKNQTVYFRTIMYGKHVPRCDRAIHLK